MIDSQAHRRQGVGASNFGVRVLEPQSELLSQALKDQLLAHGAPRGVEMRVGISGRLLPRRYPAERQAARR